LNYFGTGARDVAAILSVDKHDAHIADDPTGEEPPFYLGLGNENAVYSRTQSGDIDVAEVVRDEEERRFRGHTDHLDLHPGDADKALRPALECELSPECLVRDKGREHEPKTVKAQGGQNKRDKTNSSPNVFHRGAVQGSADRSAIALCPLW
jgi:hypothetical protein